VSSKEAVSRERSTVVVFRDTEEGKV